MIFQGNTNVFSSEGVNWTINRERERRGGGGGEGAHLNLFSQVTE